MYSLSSEDFVALLTRFDRGLIVAWNLYDGLDLLPETNVRQLLEWWKGLFEWKITEKYPDFPSPVDEEKELIDVLDSLLFDVAAKGFRHGTLKPDFRLLCRRVPDGAVDESDFAHVTTASVVLNYLMDDTQKRAMVGEMYLWNALVPEAQVRLLMDEASRWVQLNPTSILGGHRVVWFTPFSAMPAGPWTADSMRDLLGLLHHNSGIALLLMRLPGEFLQTRGTARPTLADAGNHARFKTVADDPNNRQKTAWGHTVDLKKFLDKNPILDGMPERVAEPIPAFDLPMVETYYLGYSGMARGFTVDDDHASFAARMQNGRDIGVMKTLLEGLLP